MEQEIIKLRSEGYGYKAIANKLGITRDKVRVICSKIQWDDDLLNESAKSRFYYLFNEQFAKEYELLTEYSHSTQKIRVRHKPCGQEIEILPFNLLQKTVCRVCKKLTECIHCGQVFIRKTSDKFCSSECAENYRAITYGPKTYSKTCPVCSKEFVADMKDKKYCSADCKYKSLYKYKAKCLVCGKQFVSTKRDARFCSREHQQEFNRKSHMEFMQELIIELRMMAC